MNMHKNYFETELKNLKEEKKNFEESIKNINKIKNCVEKMKFELDEINKIIEKNGKKKPFDKGFEEELKKHFSDKDIKKILELIRQYKLVSLFELQEWFVNVYHKGIFYSISNVGLLYNLLEGSFDFSSKISEEEIKKRLKDASKIQNRNKNR